MVFVCLMSCLGIVSSHVLGGRFCWLLAATSLIVWWFSFRHRQRASGWILLLAVALTTAAWHHAQWRLYPSSHIGFQVLGGDDVAVVIRGRLTSVPESSPLPPEESNTRSLATIPQGVQSQFRLRVSQIRHLDQWVAASGNLVVRLDGHLLGMRVGDDVQLFGTLSSIPQPMNPGERDLRLSARAERILCRLDVSYPDCVLRMPSTERADVGGVCMAAVGRLRSEGLKLLDKYVASPRDVLAGALLLGARDRLEYERTEVFFQTGTVHLLAISGLHLGILASVFFVFAKNSSFRRRAITALMLFTMLYCFLTGMREPVLRAAILLQVVCVGMIWRRRILAYNALASAAVVVLAVRPAALFRPGAQLSFLAVATLIWLSLNYKPRELTPLEKLVERARPWYSQFLHFLREKAAQLAFAGLAVWVVTMPLVMMNFHLVSPIALVLNVLLAFPISISLLSGFFVLLTGKLLQPLAATCGWFCDRGLAFVEGSVGWAHQIPGAYFWVGGPNAVWCAVFYVGLALMAFAPRLRPTRLGWSVWLVVWFAIPVFAEFADTAKRRLQPTAPMELRCTFLSVGHGTCVVLELPDERVLLYDCGRMGIPVTGVRVVSEFLWHRRISHIDGVILSHADADHYNILPDLLDRFSVGQVLTSDSMFDSTAAGVRVLRDAIDAAKVPIATLKADDQMRFGESTLRVLHPLLQRVPGSDNANSIVLEVEYEGKVILLPGDLEARGLQDVIAERPRDCDVLMAPHHGSLNSSPALFTRWCTPEWLVISGGRDRELEMEQHRVFSELGCQVMHTAEVGAVTVRIESGELMVNGFHEFPNPKVE